MLPDEPALLAAFASACASRDPDVITGWNVIEFDLAGARAAVRGARMTLDLGRVAGRRRGPDTRKQRPARGEIAGRSVVDAMRLVRASGERVPDQSLDGAAQALLGEAKTVSLRGSAKLDELERLRTEEPAAFCAYCCATPSSCSRSCARPGSTC